MLIAHHMTLRGHLISFIQVSKHQGTELHHTEVDWVESLYMQVEKRG